MNKEDYNPLILFFVSCQFIAIVSILTVLWLWGTNDPKPLVPMLLPFLALGFLFSGTMDFRIAIRRGVKGFKLKALGCWLVAIALIDAWLSSNTFVFLDIILLILSGLLLIPSMWAQISVIRIGRRAEKDR